MQSGAAARCVAIHTRAPQQPQPAAWRSTRERRSNFSSARDVPARAPRHCKVDCCKDERCKVERCKVERCKVPSAAATSAQRGIPQPQRRSCLRRPDSSLPHTRRGPPPSHFSLPSPWPVHSYTRYLNFHPTHTNIKLTAPRGWRECARVWIATVIEMFVESQSCTMKWKLQLDCWEVKRCSMER